MAIHTFNWFEIKQGILKDNYAFGNYSPGCMFNGVKVFGTYDGEVIIDTYCYIGACNTVQGLKKVYTNEICEDCINTGTRAEVYVDDRTNYIIIDILET